MLLAARAADGVGVDGGSSGSQDSPRVVCLAFDALELIDAIGCAHMVVGRPSGSDATRHGKALEVGSFLAPDVDVVRSLHPDIVITSSDIQAGAVEKLVRSHCTVLALNIYRIEDIFNALRMLGRLLGRLEQGEAAAASMMKQIEAFRTAPPSVKTRKTVHFEEYDDPVIAAGEWISEMIALAGGSDVNADLAVRRSAMERTISADLISKRDPDVIIAAWCGKEFDRQRIMERDGWEGVKAIRTGHVYTIPQDLVLQPSPRIVEGIQRIRAILEAAGE